jgi:diadenosine tetraphosphate (Ap4A) HIT family hydrolase
MAKYGAKTAENKCIFCEIVAGRISANLVFWQDEEFMAFLSIDPNTEGFACVIPKVHYHSDVMKMPDDALEKFILATKKVSAILEKHFEDVGRVGVMMEGLGIDHAHIKLMPMHGTEFLKNGEWRQILSSKDFWFPKYDGYICSGSGPMGDFGKLAILAENIRKSQ